MLIAGMIQAPPLRGFLLRIAIPGAGQRDAYGSCRGDRISALGNLSCADGRQAQPQSAIVRLPS
jgi:hypothetical protein